MSTVSDNLTAELCSSSAWGQRPLMPEEVKAIIVKHLAELEKDKDRLDALEKVFSNGLDTSLPNPPKHLEGNLRGSLDWLKEELNKK